MIHNTKPTHNEIQNIHPLGHSASIRFYENKTDLEIWKAFKKGDEYAFNYIYRIYVRILFQYGCQMCKDQSVIQDCIQNIFIDLRRKREGLNDVNNIKPYLLKILYRELIRKRIKDKIRDQKSPGELDKYFSIEFSHETKIIQWENQKELGCQIQQALNSLTVRQRQAVLLLYEEGLTYKEITVALDLIEVKSARKLVYRALATLRSLLQK